MSEQSYSTEILIFASPKLVYRALTEGIGKWWTELSNQATQVGDQLVVRFEETTSWVMTVSAASPNRSLSWKVVDANHDIVCAMLLQSGQKYLDYRFTPQRDQWFRYLGGVWLEPGAHSSR